ncbi:MAG: family 1 glycosylhydrolase [Candidatus Omnitrophica bacterium]|nr:family 1 glycosylhydrolase [Candidatus Omnitrophota bacterium]
MRNNFPENFLWGASTSAHQVEGNNTGNDWWAWEQAGNTRPSGRACDHYNRYGEDFALAGKLGHNAHRLSLEWSRLEKQQDAWDTGEWDHYKRVLDTLISLDIEPVLTLHHFTIPLWLSDKGGFLWEGSVNAFSRFAAKAVRELGSRVKYWITINEPNILATLSYYFGEWPPAHRDFNELLTALNNLLKAHSAAYEHMREEALQGKDVKNPAIGIAKAVTAFHPCSALSARDRFCAHMRNRFHNHAFISSAIRGRSFLPGHKGEKLKRKNCLDFIGLNYYFRQFIHSDGPLRKNPFGEVCDPRHHHDSGPLTDMGWEIYPPGIYETVKSLSAYGLPLMIAENGLATEDDTVRQKYIKDHLSEISKALSKGFPVTGYFHWSLMDNFEWAHGYSKKFGLIEVDFDTQERKIRDSGRYYASLIRSVRGEQ